MSRTNTPITADLDKVKSFTNGIQTAWDATCIEAAQTCLRKYYYAYIEGWEPKRKSVHLLFGGMYATALENFYKYQAEGMTQDEAEVRVVREALIDSWENPLEDSKKSRSGLIRTIVWYITEYGDETYSAVKTHYLENGQPAVEVSFALDVGDDIVLCGHLDRVVDFGGLYVQDQKTTGTTISTYFFEQFNPHNQFSLYAWAGQAIFGSPIKGVMVDAAQIAVNFSRFERHVTPRTNDQLSEWWENTQYTIALAQQAAALEKFPMNLSACGNYGGCPYRSICSASPSVRANYLKADFTRREHAWDPINPR
jgi:hypothetical protein